MKNTKPILSPLFLMILLTLPAVAGVMAGAGMSHEAWREIRRDWFGEQFIQTRSHERLQITREGTPVIEKSTSEGYWLKEYRFLNGTPEPGLNEAGLAQQLYLTRPRVRPFHFPFADDPISFRLRGRHPDYYGIPFGGTRFSRRFVPHPEDPQRYYLMTTNQPRDDPPLFVSQIGQTNTRPAAEDCFFEPTALSEARLCF